MSSIRTNLRKSIHSIKNA